MKNNEERIIIVSCALAMDEKMLNVWNTLAKHLKNMNCKLLLLTTSVCEGLQFDFIQIPFSLDQFDELNIELDNESYYDDKAIAITFTKREIEWFNKPKENWYKHFKGYYKCKDFYRSIINSVRPSLVVAWQNSLPQSNILKRLAEEYSIPSFILERGMLPDSFMIESWGNVALSDLVNNFAIRNSIRNNSDYSSFDKIKEFYLKEKPVKYNQKSYEDSKSELIEIFRNSKPTLVYFANVDSSVGIYPEDTMLSYKTSSVYKNSKETIKKLSKLAEKKDLNLIIKLHPHDSGDYSASQTDKTIILRDFNYQLLMEKGDVLAFSCTTLQFEALLYEKPVLLLANTELSGFDIVYEVNGEGSLESVFDEAINKENFDQKNQNAKKYINWITANFLFAYSDNQPIKNSTFDLATYFSSIAPVLKERFNLGRFDRLSAYLLSIKYPHQFSIVKESDISSNYEIISLNKEKEKLTQLELMENLIKDYESGRKSEELFNELGKIFIIQNAYSTAANYFHKAKAYKKVDEESSKPESFEGADEKTNNYKTLLEIAQNCIEAGKIFEGYTRVQNVLDKDNNYEPARKLLSEIMEIINTKNHKDIWTSKKSVALILKAEEKINKNNLESAKEDLVLVLNHEPENLEALNDYSVVLIMEEKYSEAKDIIDIIFKLEPINEIAIENLNYLIENKLLSEEDIEFSEYEKKIKREVEIYENQVNVHNLPECHHQYTSKVVSIALNELTGRNNYLDWFANELDKLAENLGRPIEGLSIGSGNGDTEVDIYNRLKNKDKVKLIGVDINPTMVERGKKLAEEKSYLMLDFQVGDFNYLKLNKKYDFYIANHSLHHVTNLENLFEVIDNNSTDEMIFLINDMIGRNGHVMWPGTKKIVDLIWSKIERKYKYNHYTHLFDDEVFNLDCSTEGFEGIRAEDILPLLNKYFDYDIYLPFSVIVSRFIDRAYGHNFIVSNIDDMIKLRMIIEMDIKILTDKKLSPTQALMKFIKRGKSQNQRFFYQTPDETINARNYYPDDNYIELLNQTYLM